MENTNIDAECQSELPAGDVLRSMIGRVADLEVVGFATTTGRSEWLLGLWVWWDKSRAVGSIIGRSGCRTSWDIILYYPFPSWPEVRDP